MGLDDDSDRSSCDLSDSLQRLFRGHVIVEKWLISWVVSEFFDVAMYCCLGPARIPCENYSSAPELMNLGKT